MLNIRKLTAKEKKYITHLNTLKQIEVNEVREMLKLYNELFHSKVECLTCGILLKNCIQQLVEEMNKQNKK